MRVYISNDNITFLSFSRDGKFLYIVCLSSMRSAFLNCYA